MEVENAKSKAGESANEFKFMNEFWFQVKFVLNTQCVGPEVLGVYLTGDFNQWRLLDSYRMRPCSEGVFIRVPLSEGYYQYKFVVMVPSEENASESTENGFEMKTENESDDIELKNNKASNFLKDTVGEFNLLSRNAKQVWIRDPNSPYVGGVHDNSIMFVHMDPGVYGIRPQHAPHRDYRRPGSDGSEFHTLCPPIPPEIEVLGILQRLVFVYLPPSYGREETRRYPVLYANDGQALFSTPAHAGGPCKGGYCLDEKLDYFWDKRLLPEFILVGVPNSDFVCIGNRNLEYCTSEFHDTSKDPYKRYLVEVVKKEIDSKYRTQPDGGNSVIMGSSMGGLCAFALSLNHPDLFSSAVCISSSFWYADKYNKSAYDLLRSRSNAGGNASNNQGGRASKPDIAASVSSGSRDFVSASNSFSADVDPVDLPQPVLPESAALASTPLTSVASSLPDPVILPAFRPRIYIDSGDGLGDNFYETKEMNETFLECGWKEGEEFKYVLDECAEKTGDGITHLESIWKERILPPLQFAFRFTPPA